MGFIAAIFAKPKLLLGLMVLTALVLAWSMFQSLTLERDRARAALERANQMLAAAEDRLAINQNATSEAERSRALDRRLDDVAEAARQEIDHAEDFHQLYAVWVDNVGRVRNDDPGLDAA